MTYDNLLEEAHASGAIVKEVYLKARDGICRGNRIAIDTKLNTYNEKACVLAEELGHYYLTVGNITDLSKIENIKQEFIARKWAIRKLVGIMDIIQAFEYGARNIYDMAEYLNVTEEFLKEAIIYYENKYGISYEIDNYIIYFQPYLGILKMY